MSINEKAFEAFMLAYHENGGTGLGFRKCLEAYETAKPKPDDAMVERLQNYVDAKSEVSGLHHDIIHVIVTAKGKFELRISDLKSAIAAINDYVGDASARKDEGCTGTTALNRRPASVVTAPLPDHHPIEQLKAVLCDPEGEVCIAGSQGERDVIQGALKALERVAGATSPATQQPDELPIIEDLQTIYDSLERIDTLWADEVVAASASPDLHARVTHEEVEAAFTVKQVQIAVDTLILRCKRSTEREAAQPVECPEDFEETMIYSPLERSIDGNGYTNPIIQAQWQGWNKAIRKLPEGMEHRSIRFLECEKGHGRLIASNWIDGGCNRCEIERLKATKREYDAHLPGGCPLYNEEETRHMQAAYEKAKEHHGYTETLYAVATTILRMRDHLPPFTQIEGGKS